MNKMIKKSLGQGIIIMLVTLTFVIVVFCYRLLIRQDTISSIAYSSLKTKMIIEFISRKMVSMCHFW